MTLNTDKLNQPPRKPGATVPNCTQSGPTAPSEAGSLAIAHGVRMALNEQQQHIAGIQQAAIAALTPLTEDTSDFLADVISGRTAWAQIALRTQQKLEALPKCSAVTVDLGLEPLPKLSFALGQETPSLSSGSSDTSCKPE